MGALRPFAILVGLALTMASHRADAGGARVERIAAWRPQIVEASVRFGIPAVWIERVMRAESGGQIVRNGLPIRSRAGAMGLMQLTPGTWVEARAALALGDNPDDPRDNILAGTWYLRRMYDRFGYPGLFAAYNAGPARYDDHLRSGRALPAETIAYLASVSGVSVDSDDPVRQGPPPRLFVIQREPAATVGASDGASSAGSLFMVRSNAR